MHSLDDDFARMQTHIIRHEWVSEKSFSSLESFVQSQKGMSNYFRFSVTHSTLWIKRRTFCCCPEIIIIKMWISQKASLAMMSERVNEEEREREQRGWFMTIKLIICKFCSLKLVKEQKLNKEKEEIKMKK